MRKALVAGIIIVVAVGAFFVYRTFFGEKVPFETASISPDGMYRCEVHESYTTGQCRTSIKVFHRAGSGDNPWQLVKAKEVANDSACRSNYSVDWRYDSKHRTEGVVVFGDFGSPPFPGEVIFETQINDTRQAPPQAETPTRQPPRLSQINTPLDVILSKGGKLLVLVTQTQLSGDEGWAEDQFQLTAMTNGDSWTHRFSSSYGSFKVEVIDLNGGALPELVLIQGTGRGTSVRSERLVVLGLRDTMVELETVPFSGYFGSGAKWWYEHEYVDVDRDGRSEIRLRLKHTPIGEGGLEQPNSIPHEEEVVIDLGPGRPQGLTESSSAQNAGQTKQQAVEIVMKLPEVRAWSTFIRSASEGRAHGVAMAASKVPERIGGVNCWPIRFGENLPDWFHPWEEFAVNAATGEVFVVVLGDEGEELRPLSKWRSEGESERTGTTLLTKNYRVTIYDFREEGEVASDNVIYHGVSRKSGKDIILVGSTWHHMVDGVPGMFRGWKFQNGDTTYYVHQDGLLSVVQGDAKVLVDERGTWQ